MKEEESIRWNQVMKMLGWGDTRSAKIWFIGLEEASGFKGIEDFEKLQKEEFRPYQGCKGEKTPIYVIMSKIVLGLRGENWRSDWSGYRDNKLFAEGSDALQTNLYPLGKKKLTEWPEQYGSLFGISAADYYGIMSDSNNSRYRLIRERRKDCGDPLTICFGTSGWRDFVKCLELDHAVSEELNGLFRFYAKEKVVLTPFFWSGGKNGLSDVRIQQLIEAINKLGLNPLAPR